MHPRCRTGGQCIDSLCTRFGLGQFTSSLDEIGDTHEGMLDQSFELAPGINFAFFLRTNSALRYHHGGWGGSWIR